jgi:hypothetical protein
MSQGVAWRGWHGMAWRNMPHHVVSRALFLFVSLSLSLLLHTVEGKEEQGMGSGDGDNDSFWSCWVDVTSRMPRYAGCLALAGLVFPGERGGGKEVPPG